MGSFFVRKNVPFISFRLTDIDKIRYTERIDEKF